MTDDLLGDETRRLLAHEYLERCTGTLGRRPSWMSPDQYDPCLCELANGHEGDHSCEHGHEANYFTPGELLPRPPTSIDVPRDLLGGLLAERDAAVAREADALARVAQLEAERDALREVAGMVVRRDRAGWQLTEVDIDALVAVLDAPVTPETE